MNALTKTIWSAVPLKLRPFVKELYFDMMLQVDALRGQQHGMIPPTRMNFVGTKHDFVELGKEFLGFFQRYGKLTPDSHVLDVGSGIGRMAIPLTVFLGEKGSYLGFDIVKFGVKWCRNKISSQFPRFRFEHADIHNGAYNPGGKIPAAEYVFPCPNRSIDFAFATSVFTHLLTKDTEHYLRETARVLAPEGRALYTFFLLDDTTRAAMKSGKASYDFCVATDGNERFCFTNDSAGAEWAIAFDKEKLVQRLPQYGLALVEFVPGKWSGNPEGVSFQDFVILKKA